MKEELKAQVSAWFDAGEVGGRNDALDGDAGLNTALRSNGIHWQELKILKDLLCPCRAREKGKARHGPWCLEAAVVLSVGWNMPRAAS